MWVLGVKPRPSGRAVSALDSRIIAPAPWLIFEGGSNIDRPGNGDTAQHDLEFLLLLCHPPGCKFGDLSSCHRGKPQWISRQFEKEL